MTVQQYISLFALAICVFIAVGNWLPSRNPSSSEWVNVTIRQKEKFGLQ
jgi:hypothetical protein